MNTIMRCSRIAVSRILTELKIAVLETRATQPTLPAGPTSTTSVLYVDSVPHREKELASTSLEHVI